MKKRVSRNIRIARYLIIPWIIGLIYFDIHELFHSKKLGVITILSFSISILMSIIGYFIFKYLDKVKTIEFDDNHLYISDKFGMSTIPLIWIISLKMTTLTLNGNSGWKIIYKDMDNTEHSANFFPRFLNINLEEFKQAILRKNQNTKIQHSYFGPFEIDYATND